VETLRKKEAKDGEEAKLCAAPILRRDEAIRRDRGKRKATLMVVKS
jgi:hypothetical protein